MLALQGLVGLHRTIQLQFLQHYWLAIDLDYCDIEWFASETNRDHSIVLMDTTLQIKTERFFKYIDFKIKIISITYEHK